MFTRCDRQSAAAASCGDSPWKCEKVPGTGDVARFPVETLGTHKDGNTEHNVTSTGSPTATPGNESLTKQPH
jgi:hypothetical protein